MTVTLELKPEIERGLLTQAQERGVSLDAYLQAELSRLAKVSDAASPVRKLGGEEWAKQFDEWADSFPDAPPIPDEALSRENLYPDRS